MGIMASAPFNCVDDEYLAIAYISMFIIIFLVCFYFRLALYVRLTPLRLPSSRSGASSSFPRTFEAPEVDSEELREGMHLRRRRLAANASRLLRVFRHSDRACDTEAGNNVQEKDTISHNESVRSKSIISHKALTSTLPASTTSDENRHSWTCRRPSSLVPSVLSLAGLFDRVTQAPIPVVIAVSVVTALVDPLKVLFLLSIGQLPTELPARRAGWPAATGRWPLSSNTAGFVGAASVPIGLICLGSALAYVRLRSVETFPHGAITALALARIVVTPLLGVGITRWLFCGSRRSNLYACACPCPRSTRYSSTRCGHMVLRAAFPRVCRRLPLSTQVSGLLALVFGMYSLASLGVPHENLLAYWLRGTLFGVLDPAVHPDAFHYDWIGCIYAQLPLLRTLDSK